jgi:hypothetical protein
MHRDHRIAWCNGRQHLPPLPWQSRISLRHQY